MYILCQWRACPRICRRSTVHRPVELGRHAGSHPSAMRENGLHHRQSELGASTATASMPASDQGQEPCSGDTQGLLLHGSTAAEGSRRRSRCWHLVRVSLSREMISAYQGPVFHRALAGILPDLETEIVKRSDQVLPSDVGWSNAWLNRCRRLAKDWEKTATRHQARVHSTHRCNLHKVSGRTLSSFSSAPIRTCRSPNCAARMTTTVIASGISVPHPRQAVVRPAAHAGCPSPAQCQTPPVGRGSCSPAGCVADQKIPGSVQGQYRLLLRRLDGDKMHRWPRHRLADRCRVTRVGLAPLDIGLNIDRRHQLDPMGPSRTARAPRNGPCRGPQCRSDRARACGKKASPDGGVTRAAQRPLQFHQQRDPEIRSSPNQHRQC